ncbi:MAG TPA: Rho-binding antiterminator [Flavobacteriales bacterium]|nr:Rho-binding antiterminator [Flavobacteriales bacterium]
MIVKGPKRYEPIDCSLYDHYEAAATRKEKLRITMDDGSEHHGVIVDLFIRDKVEWMRLDGGEEIRLDSIANHRSAKNV